MGKRYGCFFIIGVRKLERIHIFCISYITFRCLIFLYRIGISDWQIYCEFCSSVCASSYFLNQRSFFHNNASVCISDVIGCIQSKNTAFQWFLGVFILFYYRNICFLSLVVKSHICKYNFFILSGISQSHWLFFTAVIEIVRCFCFFYYIGSKMQVFQCNRTILTCCQVFFYQVTFAVHFCAISSYDISSGIHVIYCIFLSAVFILEYRSIFTDFCSGKHLSFFVNGKLCKLFFIFYSHRGSLTCYQFYICCRCIYYISLWCCDLFQINGILCLDDRNRRFSILICCRHLSDQLCTSLIAVYTEYCTCKIDISCIVFLYDFDRSPFNPGHL